MLSWKETGYQTGNEIKGGTVGEQMDLSTGIVCAC
jgi:hypothetical protein